MAPPNPRPLFAFLLGGLIAVVAWATKLMHGLSPATHALPLLLAPLGWAILDSWRNAEGRQKMAPILHYSILVIFAFILFGWLFSSTGQFQPLAAVLAISLLAPAILDLMHDRASFVKEKEEGGESEAYGAQYPGAVMGRIVPPSP